MFSGTEDRHGCIVHGTLCHGHAFGDFVNTQIMCLGSGRMGWGALLGVLGLVLLMVDNPSVPLN